MIQRSIAKKRSGEGGFTLVELLIVIVILGILAAIVVLAIGGLKDTSQKAACSSGAKTMESAEDAYFASHDNGDGTLGGAYGVTNDLVGDNLLKGGAPTGLDATLPVDDQHYVISGSGKCASMTDVTGP